MVLYRRRKFLNFNLSKIKRIKQDKNFSFSKYTTYQVGGGCRQCFLPRTFNETKTVFDYLKSRGKFFILGGGSNILASDKGFLGGVLCTKNLCGIYRTKKNEIFCKAGTTVSKLLSYCKINGLEGLEYLAGIPATVGGLTFMNGGAGGKFLSQNVKKVIFYDGKMNTMSDIDCKFSYKYSTLRDIMCVILGTYLTIFPSSPQKVDSNIKFYLNARKSQPKGKSCGCVFKNIGDISAGKIIDDCGLKGANVGGAYVSPAHANFIINGGSSAKDIYDLISLVKQSVFTAQNLRLEEEVIYIGDFL
jgi:UDP-N-acetylmuramate dehydrogenase